VSDTKKKMSAAKIERTIESVLGSMELSGFTMTEKDAAKGRAILNGEIDAEKNAAQLIAKYRSENGREPH